MGNKVYKVINKKRELLGYSFHCPGCGYQHCYHTEKPNPIGAIWTFNGDLEKPTFKDSLLVNKSREGGYPLCHLFVTDGEIRFLSDCTHKLAGQTLEMEDIE